MTRKHEANIKKSKWINIQLWIIAVLSFSYFMYEIHMYSEPSKDIAEKPYVVNDSSDEPDDPDRIYGGVEVYRAPVTKIKKVAKVTEAPPIKVDNNTPEPKEIEEPIKNEPEVKKQPNAVEGKKQLNTDSKKTKTKMGKSKAKPTGPYTPLTVDFLPVFPGCDRYSTNDERAACFQKKIQRHVNNKFNSGLGEELGLKGIQRIFLHFEIDINGNISNVRARSVGNIIDLEKEAIRVAKKLPKMEPARSGKRKVKMSYDMPIVFDVR